MTKKLVCLLTVLTVVCLVATCLVACNDKGNGDTPDVTQYSVTVNYNYEGAPAPVVLTVESGKSIAETLLTAPTRSGYEFAGWYLDAAGNTPLNFENGESALAVSKDITIYAKWTEATPAAKKLASISATYSGGEVTVGGTIDETKIAVTATYSDGTTAAVTGFRLGVFDARTAGTKNVTVTYSEDGVTKTATFEVTVKADDPVVSTKTLRAIRVAYMGGEIEKGGAIDDTKLTVTATYSDGSTKAVTEYALAGFDGAEVGQQTVTVTYAEDGVSVTATFDVTVKADAPVVTKTLVSISVTYAGGAIEKGGAIDTTKLTVTATYSDGSTKAVTEYALSGFDGAEVGQQTVTVTYAEDGLSKTDTFTVTVKDEEIIEPPFEPSEETRTIYFTNNKGWDSLKVYAFNGAANAEVAEWPGEGMDFFYNNDMGQAVYSYTLSVSYDYVVFNSGDAKTVDIQLSEDVNAYYIDGDEAVDGKWAVGTWNYEAPAEKELVSIKADYNGAKVTVGQDIDKANLTVTAIYDDESEIEVDAEDYTIDVDNTAAGTVKATVTYQSKTVEFDVTFEEEAEPFVPSEEKRTIYFTNNKGWDSLKVYAYNGAAGAEVAEWPGEGLEYVYTNDMSQAVYSYTLSVSYDYVVFNSGDAKTVDIQLTEDVNGYYIEGDEAVEGKWAVGTWNYEVPAEKELVSISAVYSGPTMMVGESLSADKIVVTATYSDESVGTVAAGEYELAYDNDEAGTVTVTVTCGDVDTSFSVVYAEARTIYFKNTTWSSVNVYLWNGVDSEYKEWEHMDLMTPIADTDFYQYTFPEIYTIVIFAASGVQTVDIDLSELPEGKNAYELDGGSDDGKLTVKAIKYPEEEPEYENVTVSFMKPEGWAAVYAYVFVDEDGLVDWPGTALELADGVYSYTFSEKYTSIVFNNGLTGDDLEQTVDLEYEADTTYTVGAKNGEGKYTVTKYVAPEEPEYENVTVSFIKPEGWAAVYAYVFVDEDGLVDWPGTALELADGVYSYTFSEKYTSIVFSNGLTEDDLEQTVDLEYETDTTYTVGAKNGEGKYTVSKYVAPEEPEAWDGVLSFDLTDVTWFENADARAYIYVWYTDSTNDGWPITDNIEAHRATRTEGFKYTYQTDADKTIAGVIVVRGNQAGTEMWNKSADLSDDGTHVIKPTSEEIDHSYAE